MARVASFPRARKPELRLTLPSARACALAAGLVALAGAVYLISRETSAFAVEHVLVAGGSPRVDGEVRRAVADLRGSSLLALDGGALVRRVEALPSVVHVEYDRAFPHTLRLRVVPEEPVAVVRQGAQAWVASARGRVIRAVPPHGARPLARIWIPRTTPVRVGGFLPARHATAIAHALALAHGFPAHIAVAALRRDGLVFRLRSGLDLRLGEPSDVRLKLAVARRALRRLPAGALYLDITVPGRPVAGTNSQVSGRG